MAWYTECLLLRYMDRYIKILLLAGLFLLVFAFGLLRVVRAMEVERRGAVFEVAVGSTVEKNVGKKAKKEKSTKKEKKQKKQRKQKTPRRSSSSAGQMMEATSLQATIENFAFAPASLKVKKGTTVTWTNKDSVGHTVTGENGGWGSALLAKGQSYSHTFSEVGSFPYYCRPHPWITGTVEVGE